MRILYIGDIMGEPGIEVVAKVLPPLIKDKKIDLVIAQAENITEGRGIIVADMKRLQRIGVDFFTGGNWSLYREEIHQALDDDNQPIIRPANYSPDMPGKGHKFIEKSGQKVLVVSLLGKVVGRDAELRLDNPLKRIDEILESNKENQVTIVNFHGDYSSEKRVIGFYLDGRVTAVIGDHWHVPTADAAVLPKGTAHITDVGMCGTLNSSLGVKLETITTRWRNATKNLNDLETSGPFQFNSVLIETNKQGLAKSIKHIQKIIN